MSLYSLFSEQLRPYRYGVLSGVVLMVLEMATALATPWLAGEFAQQVLGRPAETAWTLASLLTVWAAILIAQFTARALSRYRLSVVAARVMIDLSRRVHDHLQFLPLSFHQERKTGELLALLSHDVTQLSHFVTGPLAGAVPQLVLLVGAAVMLLVIDPLFGAVILLATPLLLVLVKLVARNARPIAAAAVREQAESLAVASETLGMLRLIKAHALEEIRSRAYRKQTETVLGLRRRQLWLQAVATPVVYLMASLLLLGLLAWAGQRLQAGTLSAPVLISISLYGLLLIRPVSGLGGLFLQLEQTRGAAERLMALLAERPEPFHSDGLALAPMAQSIEIRGLAFAYPGRGPLLHDIDLLINRGEIVAITGPNGAGKTTLAHLLMRFVSPTRGRILIDGQDIAGSTLSSLRSQTGYVPQEVLIANGSIRDNIAFGRPDATTHEVVAAAKAAHAHAFIEALPDGYATPVGDLGVKLSGGQRQRLALARALLGEPRILILDEPTSQIDREGEAAFVAAAASALSGHTAIIVTHRPGLLALATRVYRLEDGRLSELQATPRDTLPHT